ncbi:hypothetical protein GCM10008107_00390 [Psychrosphaera saromensis]|uniref:VanZ-like domain-containing protein n=1 Tax=Psychrosphaera saromensis TaxID=716813 RepID=A0A2S7UZ49_9GAMM|nr:hypothetical protein [Psychrosphaera saromensis]PQJ54985.1 hypothetical protein BTO11_15860 [Psychrosphaera saromensis]GHB55615.1 hypothetical protein GCM10008107_00390 [Psychrosphaera saromensis]GLQ13761.1 hypothetical protein GCM10007917_12160 [Psychrosphaera saromensis]
MQFKSKTFYIYSFSICLFLALLVKFFRESLYGINLPIDMFLGSAPSFLYLFGLISAIPIFYKNIEFSSFQKSWFALTCGALIYEFEQYWTSRVFDYNDVIATLLGLVLIVIIHRANNTNT